MTLSKEARKLGYSIPEFAEATSLGRSKIYQEINNGNLKARKFGKRTVIIESDAIAYLESLPLLEVKHDDN
jgi:excisionase family DNA binding protein